MTLSTSELALLTKGEDIFYVKYWLKQGTSGLSLMVRKKNEYEQKGHCNDFRNKSLSQINKELKN